jgi:hypothetical protein
MRSRIREWLARLALVVVSTSLALACAEVAARIVHPISDGRQNVTLGDRPIKSWFEPGSVYRQVGNEYDARTTITDKGHRVPGTDGNPDVVFIGDSFTFGWGIEDADTFTSIYCSGTGRSCANLGIPGSGTAKQLNRLAQYLDRYQWRPTQVKLVFFGMSSSWSAGNDFVDNYDERALVDGVRAASTPTAAPAVAAERKRRISLSEWLIGQQSKLLGYSNLMRLAKFYWGPTMKSLVIAEPGPERFERALHYTRINLQRLDQMSRERGFDYRIYLIVPVQDIIRGTYSHTLAAVSRVSPRPVTSTAHLFVDDPASYYYAFDGHINSKASRRIGEFLVALEDVEHRTAR